MRTGRIVLSIAVLVGVGALTVQPVQAQSAGTTSEEFSRQNEFDETSSIADWIGRERPPDVWGARYQLRDPLWNGAAIGAGTALSLGLAYCLRASEGGETCDDRADWLILLGAVGAAVGAGIDALLTRRPVYNRRPATSGIVVRPAISRSAGRAILTVRASVWW